MRDLLPINAICLLTMLLTCVTGSLIFRNADKATRYFCISTIISFMAEFTGRIAASHFHNNLPVYNIGGIMELMAICLYFNYSIALFKRYNIGWLLAIVSALFGIVNLLFFQSILAINSNFLFFEGVLIVTMSLLSLISLLYQHNNLQLKTNPHFYIAGLLAVFWSVTFPEWGIYDYLLALDYPYIRLLNIFFLVVNILANTGACLVFIFYPRMSHKHE